MRIEEVEEEPPRKDEKLESALKMLKSYVKARDEGVAPKNADLEDLLGAMKQQEGCPQNINLPKVGTDRSNSETIIPKPFFVVKSMTSKDEKIFINICGSLKIPAPAEWEEGIPPEVEEALKANKENESLLDMPSLRFPVSCSDPVTSTDHGDDLIILVYSAELQPIKFWQLKMLK
ncbi:hypothetical protein R1sor_019802 [Riccia sorocarpa]|uniref:PIH1 N-terminal domain-containing protein n=1 Tax=Riccia sorocarpa TaxID=122646 RepID=A0ABD3IHC8_9MARC